MTTGKFTLVIRWPSGQSTICGEMTDHQHGEICRILSPDYRAQVSQGGEAVEVVGYHNQISKDWSYVGRVGWEPLMTVAQHQRILAAATNPADQGGEAVATDAFVPGSLADLLFQLGEKGIGVSGGTHGDHWRVTPLYTHPADQVAECERLRDLLADWASHFTGPKVIGGPLSSLRERTEEALLNGGRP